VHGFDIVSGGTDNHLMVVDLRKKNVGGKDYTDALDKAGISASQSTIPNDPNPPMNPSGVRLGTPAITTRGMTEDDMIWLAAKMNDIAANWQDDAALAAIKAEVEEKAAGFPVPGIS